ncbi:FKBP-type peptidyl-prolyl cis-trans isomerase [Hahella ganghwensis]|uniref:FKBP-type peptidyl-prolyl cis-trans isomerase n=1 Tax=Hahella ganghwensis TaxID=286420 RepID=UPI000367222E|nr:peptidylprolyl isomerase [Hahella ganghwensis]
MTELYVGHGVKITLNFELRLESGEVVDSTFNKAPGSFEFGDGTLPAGFEELMRGMGVGERKVFEVKPEHGFGMVNPQNVQTFRRDDFAHLDSLEPGMVMSFADAAKAELPGVIAKVSEDEVVVDFNHPLAGHQLAFEVEIIALSEVGAEESHGH